MGPALLSTTQVSPTTWQPVHSLSAGSTRGASTTSWSGALVPVTMPSRPGATTPLPRSPHWLSAPPTVVRRDTGDKQRVSVQSAPASVAELMDQIQHDMLAAATEFRDSNTADAATIDEVLDASTTGFARVPWSVVAGEDARVALVDKAVTVRCIQRADGTIPDNEDEADLVAYCARSY